MSHVKTKDVNFGSFTLICKVHQVKNYERERIERERERESLSHFCIVLPELPSVQSKSDPQAQPSESSTLTGKLSLGSKNRFHFSKGK